MKKVRTKLCLLLKISGVEVAPDPCLLPKISGVEVTSSVTSVESSEQFWCKICQIWRICEPWFHCVPFKAVSPEKKIEVYILMLLYFFMVKKWIPEGDSYIEVRMGCSSSCLGGRNCRF